MSNMNKEGLQELRSLLESHGRTLRLPPLYSTRQRTDGIDPFQRLLKQIMDLLLRFPGLAAVELDSMIQVGPTHYKPKYLLHLLVLAGTNMADVQRVYRLFPDALSEKLVLISGFPATEEYLLSAACREGASEDSLQFLIQQYPQAISETSRGQYPIEILVAENQSTRAAKLTIVQQLIEVPCPHNISRDMTPVLQGSMDQETKEFLVDRCIASGATIGVLHFVVNLMGQDRVEDELVDKTLGFRLLPQVRYLSVKICPTIDAPKWLNCLATSTVLQTLDLSGDYMEEPELCIQPLKELLCKSSTLEILRLGCKQLVLPVCQAIETNTSLRILTIHGGDNEPAARALAVSLARNTTIENLNWFCKPTDVMDHIFYTVSLNTFGRRRIARDPATTPEDFVALLCKEAQHQSSYIRRGNDRILHQVNVFYGLLHESTLFRKGWNGLL